MALSSDAIISFLRTKGPATPIDIARAMGENSIIISAVLVDITGQGKLKVSKRRFGNVKLYYIPEHQGQLEKMVSNTLIPEEKSMIEKIMNDKALSELDLSAQETSLLLNLEDLLPPFVIEHGNYRLKCWRTPNLEEEKATEIVLSRLVKKMEAEEPPEEEKSEPEPVPEAKPEPKAEVPKIEEPPEITAEEPQEPKIEEPPKDEKSEPPKEEKKEEPPKKKEKQQTLTKPAEDVENFRTTVRAWFEDNEIDVEEEREVEPEKIYEYDINMPTAVGKQGYIAKVLISKKKSAGQGDVSSFGTYVATKRVPGILISNTGFAKSAVKYWKKELSDIIMLVSNEDLE
jgi:hypothetical protein